MKYTNWIFKKNLKTYVLCSKERQLAGLQRIRGLTNKVSDLHTNHDKNKHRDRNIIKCCVSVLKGHICDISYSTTELQCLKYPLISSVYRSEISLMVFSDPGCCNTLHF